MRGVTLVLAASILDLALARLARHLHRIRWTDFVSEDQVPHRKLATTVCSNVVAKAPVRFPQHLVIGESGESMYSGYVNVTKEEYLFYFLAEARAGAPDDAPLIVWSNGGPGCSAMEGATTEHGPYVLFDVKDGNDKFSGKLSRNSYAWNNKAHVLYVDQPRRVGYSFGTGTPVSSSREAGRDMVQFLRGWRRLYPEHASRRIILAAESYGGKFVPAWADAILDFNEQGHHDANEAADVINVVGLLIGNGIVNSSLQDHTMAEFAVAQGLIGIVKDPSEFLVRAMMKEHLGYEPNYYDYRLKNQECCGCSSYNYKPWADWLMQPTVREALHVCGNAGFEAFGGCSSGCIDTRGFDQGDTFGYSLALERALGQGIAVTFYYGMQDTACNYVGGYRMAEHLTWSAASEFRGASLEDWRLGGNVIGKVRAGGGLTWIQVDNAGHMVPLDNPAAASFALDTLIAPAKTEDCV